MKEELFKYISILKQLLQDQDNKRALFYVKQIEIILQELLYYNVK